LPSPQQAYTDKLNTALRSLRERGGAEKELAKLGIDAILVRLNDVPADLRTAITNNGGGYVNHDIYWRCLSSPALPEGQARESATLSQLVGRPGPSDSSSSPLGQAIARDFGSFEAMRKQFNDMSLALFGSGWVWLYVHVDPSAERPAAIGTLRLRSTANQDNPQTLDQNGEHVLLLTIDVWEHAYYGSTAHKARQRWGLLASPRQCLVVPCTALTLMICSLVVFTSDACFVSGLLQPARSFRRRILVRRELGGRGSYLQGARRCSSGGA
jgi:superoxide dismutase